MAKKLPVFTGRSLSCAPESGETMNADFTQSVRVQQPSVTHEPVKQLSTRLHWTRRDLIKSFMAAPMVLALPAMTKAARTVATDLAKAYRTKAVMELKGNIVIPQKVENGVESKELPVEAKSEVFYDEQLIRASSPKGSADLEIRGSVLKIRDAFVENRINKTANRQTVREECLEAIKLHREGKTLTNCLDQPLTASERDLIEGAIATLYLDDLLPDGSINIGDTWEPDRNRIARVFNMDAVIKTTVQCELTDVKPDEAQLKFEGIVNASKLSVPTRLEVRGTATVDRKNGTIRWLAIVIREKREIAESKPGFDLTARLRILREVIATPEFSAESSELITLAEQSALELLQFRSKFGDYVYLADENWHTIRDDGIQATLRYVLDNRSVAQCTITNLPDMEPGVQLSLEGFQNDIRKSMGTEFRTFEKAEESLSATGLRKLKVSSFSQHDGVGVRWINLHLANDDGRHLNLVFTMAEDQLEAFGAADEQIISSLEFKTRTTDLNELNRELDEPAKSAKTAQRNEGKPPTRK